MASLAIIGVEIGVCSVAYIAHRHLPDSKAIVDEMEDRIGGRVLTFHSNEMKNELRATFFNLVNKIVCILVKEMNLPVKKLEEPMDIAVYDGTEIVFKSDLAKFFYDVEVVDKIQVWCVEAAS